MQKNIATRSWGCGELKNVNTPIVQKAHKPVGTSKLINFLRLRIVPSMEIHASSWLNLARNNRYTNARNIATRSWGCVKFKNVNTEFVQKAHKPVGTCEVINFLQLRIVPSMEIHASSRLNLPRNNRYTNARNIATRSWGCVKFKNVNTEFVQKAHKPVGTCEVINFLQLHIVPSMEIHASSRLTLARNNRCTNARTIATRSWGCGEFKNVNIELMQKVRKPVGTCEVINFLQWRIVTSIEILASSRLNLDRNNRCTNARSIATWSWGCGEFKIVNTEFVQKVHKPVGTFEIINFLQRRIVASIEILAISRLTLARNNRCINARSIATRSRGCGKFKNVNTEFVQKAHKPVGTCEVIHFLHRRILPSMEIHASSRLTLAWDNPCSNARSIATRSWGCVEFKIVNA